MSTTFPRPSADVITLAKTDVKSATLRYREEAEVAVEDGSTVRPTLSAALTLMKSLASKPKSKASIPLEGNAVMACREPLPGEVVS